MDPRKKKDLSLAKDRRNTYGENPDASRRGVRLHKRWANRSYRHAVKQKLSSLVPEKAEQEVGRTQRSGWRKPAGQPLGEVLGWNLNGQIVFAAQEALHLDGSFLEVLEASLVQIGFHPTAARVTVRRLKSRVEGRITGDAGMNLGTATQVWDVMAALLSEEPEGGDSHEDHVRG
jgi:hypothetical protein